MKKIILFASRAAVVAGCLSLGTTAWSQSGRPAAKGAQEARPHMIGLIDMAYVFKNYKKFDALREDLKADIATSEDEAKVKAASIKALQDEMKTLKETSPDFSDKEQKLAKMTAEFEAFRRSTQRDILKAESEIYHTVYMEVSDAVRRYSNHYGYTLVLRFNREELNKDDPQGLIQGMNRQVVHFQPEDDMTESVLDHLNKKWEAGQKSTGAREATGPKKSKPQ